MRVPLQPRRELIPYIILAAAVALTAGLTWYAHVSGTTRERIVFEGTADGVRAAIESRFDTHMAMLLGGAGLFAASDEVTLQEFRRYVARLRLEERYPGIQGIGFTRVVRPDERLEVLERMRAEFPEFRFWPEPPDALFTAIVYLEPLDERNRIALGYDMASEEVRAEAMSRARDEARPAATGVVELVQERHDPARAQAGFLIYVPLYAGGGIPETIAERRQALEGFVYSPFRADDLLSSIFPRAVPTVTAIDVFEGTPSEGTPLHRRRRTKARR